MGWRWGFGCVVVGVVCAIEEPRDSAVETLTIGSFAKFVRAHPFSVVEFYAPWCGHCQALAPKYRSAAAQLRGRVAFGKMDDTDEENRRLRAGSGEMYNFTHFPALVVFFDEATTARVGHQVLESDGLYGPQRDALGNLWDRYYGGTESEEIVWWLTQMLEGRNPIVEEREVLKPGLYKTFSANVDEGANGKPAVVDIDPAGLAAIASEREDDNRLWVVEFYSDRCPHCKQLLPEVVKAAKRVKGTIGRSKVGFAAINARVFFEETDKWGITGLPWVTAWYRGKKLEDMAGLSDASSIIRWATRMHEMHWRKDGAASAGAGASAGAAAAARAQAQPSAESRLVQCVNSGICACEERPRCLCAENPKANGCCNMGCGSCADVCKAVAELQAPSDINEPEPPDLPSLPSRETVEVSPTGETTANATQAVPTRAWREELGSHTWFFLHTLAAKYPEQPSEADKAAMRWQVAALGQFYPCEICRAHLREKLLRDIEPVDVADRAALSLWFCRLHNLVNKDLSKPQHDCDLRALDARYLKDCADCSVGSRFSSQRGSAAKPAQGPTFFAAAYATDPAGYIAAAAS